MTDFNQETFDAGMDAGMDAAVNSKFWAASQGLSKWCSASRTAAVLEACSDAYFRSYPAYKQGACIMRETIGKDNVDWLHANPGKILVIDIGKHCGFEARLEGLNRIQYRFCKA